MTFSQFQKRGSKIEMGGYYLLVCLNWQIFMFVDWMIEANAKSFSNFSKEGTK